MRRLSLLSRNVYPAVLTRQLWRSIIGLAILFLVPLPSQADWWVPDKNTGCKYHSYKFSDHPDIRISWSGNCKKGKLDGHGVFTLYYRGDQVVFFEGDMVEGSENRGKRVFTDGDKNTKGQTYDGEWRHGVQHGRGTQKNSHGLSFDGEWVDGVLYRVSSVTNPNGERKEVNWTRGGEINNGKEEDIAEGLLVLAGILALKGLGQVIESAGSSGVQNFGWLTLITGSLCGEGAIKARNVSTGAIANLECCGWGNLGNYSYTLPQGDYELSFEIKSCTGNRYSGKEVRFSVGTKSNTTVRLSLGTGSYTVE